MMIRVRIGIAARMTGVAIKTLHRWDESGKINSTRTAGGHSRFSIIEIHRFTGQEEPDEDNDVTPSSGDTAVYCRVSSHEQKAKGDLDRQMDVAVKHYKDSGWNILQVYRDVGSGLNAKRGGLKRLCRAIEHGSIQRVVITFKDRLTRFGFGYLESYFKSHGASITVLRQASTRSMNEELVDDLIAIVTSFSGRLHGMRGKKGRVKSRSDVEAAIVLNKVELAITRAVNRVVKRFIAEV